MSYCRHKAVIAVHDYDKPEILASINEFIASLRKRILEIDPDLDNLILESSLVANGYRTYVFVPDGHNLWSVSNRLDLLRQEFMNRFPGSILVNFGGDDSDDIYLTCDGKEYWASKYE